MKSGIVWCSSVIHRFTKRWPTSEKRQPEPEEREAKLHARWNLIEKRNEDNTRFSTHHIIFFVARSQHVQFGIITSVSFPFPFPSFGPQFAMMGLLAETSTLQNDSDFGPEKPLFAISVVTIINQNESEDEREICHPLLCVFMYLNTRT
jgi:hypothetical protein